jgi:hypothetical protein
MKRNTGNVGAAVFAAVFMMMAAPAAFAQGHGHTAGHAHESAVAGEDPRIGLRAGWMDAEEAAHGMELVANVPRPAGFYNPDNVGDLSVGNSDLGFKDNYVFVGNFNGFMIYDISDPANPQLAVSVICPGGQGDLSVYGNLLFMSVEEARGRIDCGTQGTNGRVDPERFRGVRVFDIGDIFNPMQVAAVQTCRGSHTHTVVPDPSNGDVVYVYNSGSSFVRPGEELAGCVPERPDEDPETSLFRIEVIEVPLSAPHNARVVSEPRLFADPETGDVAGLWPGRRVGDETFRSAETNHCHDITAFPELGLAAGACSGNGILIDISDPVNPVRIDDVFDPNFAYWHSATFNNDGSKVIFTDEWGGGTAARCRATDPAEWGANAIYEIVDGRMQFAGYYKLPVPQTETENCVAHNGSLVPVPGRDIKVQAWYQGGLSVFDFTDAANPQEIAFFDRGPLDAEQLKVGGFWSAYWYNGLIYGTEIARGLDVFELLPTEHLSMNELEAAREVRFDRTNVQTQERIEWPASYAVPRAFLDQLERTEALSEHRLMDLRAQIGLAEQLPEGADRQNALAQLATTAGGLSADVNAAAAAGRDVDASRLRGLATALNTLAATAR